MNAVERALDAYFEGMNGGDVDAIPLSEDVTFKGPMHDEPIDGAEAVRGFLRRVAERGTRLRLRRHVIDGHIACSLFDLVAADGTVVPACDYFELEQGRIKTIRPYFDPRPLIGPTSA